MPFLDLKKLTPAEKRDLTRADRWTGFLGHAVCGFDGKFNPIIETDSLVQALKTPGVSFVREKLGKLKRYYKVQEG